jgi:signal transduction histidine kinase
VFASVGRRLALLNALVVGGTLLAVLATSAALLLTGLERDADRALADRVQVAVASWGPDLAAGRSPVAVSVGGTSDDEASEESSDDGDEDDEENESEDDDHEASELLEHGDTLLFAFDAAGALVGQVPGVTPGGLPVAAAVDVALEGRADQRTLRLTEGVEVRVRTVPVYADGSLVGVVQGVRGLGEQRERVTLVLEVSAAAAAVGLVVSGLAGLFLARRAMRPIAGAFERQRQFVADASHELRTPLALLRANTELLQRLPRPTPRDVKSETEAMLSEIDGMARLVDDLLTLARLDAGVVPVLRPVDLGQVAAEAIEPMVNAAASAGLDLHTAWSPTPVRGDPDSLARLVRILVGNAIAYTPAGGLIEVTTLVRDRHAILTVRDTGIGIAPEHHPRVFERFFRTDPARSRRSGGSGLGLPIAQGIVRAHGGEIHLTGALGKGTTATVSLPVSPSPSGA